MFVVLALPRSRTAWLSRFLTYDAWTCGHERLCRSGSLADFEAYLHQPRTGSVETTAAPGWRSLAALSPDMKIVTIRRPVGEVLDSLMAISGVSFDRCALEKVITRADRKLDQIEARFPTLSVAFDDLKSEAVCAKVFEHCLPYPHDHAWWAAMDKVNVQIDVPALFREIETARPTIATMLTSAKQRLLIDLRRSASWQH